jgi:hypothetical protein
MKATKKTMKREIGAEIITVVSVDNKNKVLVTLGDGWFLGEEIPGPGIATVNGHDACELNLSCAKLKLKSSGDIVYGSQVHWYFSDIFTKSNIEKHFKVNEISYKEFIGKKYKVWDRE